MRFQKKGEKFHLLLSCECALKGRGKEEIPDQRLEESKRKEKFPIKDQRKAKEKEKKFLIKDQKNAKAKYTKSSLDQTMSE